MRAFDHRFMPVYRLAVSVAVDIHRLSCHLPLAARVLSDQANRAACSIVLNIAEGADEFSPKEKARFYRIARRSAAETSAALDVLEAGGHVTSELAKGIQEELLEAGAMLTGLVKSQFRRLEAKSKSTPRSTTPFESLPKPKP